MSQFLEAVFGLALAAACGAALLILLVLMS